MAVWPEMDFCSSHSERNFFAFKPCQETPAGRHVGHGVSCQFTQEILDSMVRVSREGLASQTHLFAPSLAHSKSRHPNSTSDSAPLILCCLKDIISVAEIFCLGGFAELFGWWDGSGERCRGKSLSAELGCPPPVAAERKTSWCLWLELERTWLHRTEEYCLFDSHAVSIHFYHSGNIDTGHCACIPPQPNNFTDQEICIDEEFEVLGLWLGELAPFLEFHSNLLSLPKYFWTTAPLPSLPMKGSRH